MGYDINLKSDFSLESDNTNLFLFQINLRDNLKIVLQFQAMPFCVKLKDTFCRKRSVSAPYAYIVSLSVFALRLQISLFLCPTIYIITIVCINQDYSIN